MSDHDSGLSAPATRRRSTTDRLLTASKLRYRDWVGDGVLTVVAGLAIVASVFLPWANANVGGDVNFSLFKPDRINGLMQTDWGLRVLIAGAVVTAIGVAMLALGPNRLTVPLGLASAIAGVVVLVTVFDAARFIRPRYDGGLGLALAFVVAIVLPFIGIASAMVGAVLTAKRRRGFGAQETAEA
jgi:hypothetical protein